MYLKAHNLKKYSTLFLKTGSSDKLWYNSGFINALIKFDDEEYANSYADVFYNQLSQKLGFDCMKSEFCKTQISYDKVYYYLKKSNNTTFEMHYPTYKEFCKKNIEHNHFQQTQGSISDNYNQNHLEEITFREIFQFLVTCIDSLGEFPPVNEENSFERIKEYIYSLKQYIFVNATEGKNISCDIKETSLELYKRGVIDWLLYQGDRSSWNIAFLKNKKTNELKLAPSYDNCYTYIFSNMKQYIKTPDKELAKKYLNKSTRFKKTYKTPKSFLIDEYTWFHYDIKSDLKSFEEIYNYSKTNEKFYNFIKNVLKTNFKQELQYLNSIAQLDGCDILSRDKLKFIATMIEYKQNALKNYIIFKEKNKKTYSTKTLFDFNEKSLNNLTK